MYLSSFKFNEKGEKLKILNLAVTQALINGMIPTRGIILILQNCIMQ